MGKAADVASETSPRVKLPGFVPVPSSSRDAAALLTQIGLVHCIRDASDALYVASRDLDLITGVRVRLASTALPWQDALIAGESGAAAGILEISLPGGCRLMGPLRNTPTGKVPTLLRHAVRWLRNEPSSADVPMVSLERWTLVGLSAELARELEDWISGRFPAIGRSENVPDYAGSASYMGSKRSLLPFIFTPINATWPSATTFVDLMTGSGVVAANASSRYRRTVAADPQRFSCALAAYQSDALTSVNLDEVMADLQSDVDGNMLTLRDLLGTALDEEDAELRDPFRILESSTYLRRHLDTWPNYPQKHAHGQWWPYDEVLKRQSGSARHAYDCLFVAYFSNTFYSIRQAAEIDSLHFAIARSTFLPVVKEALLGALVATASAVATTYGGHFAQPYLAPRKMLSDRQSQFAQRKRGLSVLREFEARVQAGGDPQRGKAGAIETICAPWRQVLAQLSSQLKGEDVIVYVDAPYTRDEYSRYYHVLETLCRYDFPEASAVGAPPMRGTAHRFASPFGSRDQVLVVREFVELLRAILDLGWKCAWSYSSTGAVEVANVLAGLDRAVEASSVSAPYLYQPQGTAGRPKITREILLLLESDQSTGKTPPL